MARVYEKGLPPVKKDGAKALECYKRAVEVIEEDGSKARVYLSA